MNERISTAEKIGYIVLAALLAWIALCTIVVPVIWVLGEAL